MTVVRVFLLLLLPLALVACDADREKDQPQQAQPPAPAMPQPTAPAADTLPAPAPAPLPPAGEATPPAPPPVPPAPSTLPEPPPKPLERARPAAPAAEAAVSVRPKRPELKAPLDLSLPSETPEGFGLATGSDALPGEPQTLLPPLFESKGESSSFELGGRLITNEPGQADEDNWHSVEGAELQLQFRR